MFNFNQPRYEKVIEGAIALRPKIEACVDEICKVKFDNLFLIGIGGTYAHYLPVKFMADTLSKLDVYVENAAEFPLMNNKHFSNKSIVIFCSRTGNTKEIITCAEFCREKGAKIIAFVAHDNSPLTKLADHVFINYADDDHLGESIYLQIIPCVLRFLKNWGDFSDYERLFANFNRLSPFLVKAKEQFENQGKILAEKYKDIDYHMVIGSGLLWGEAYDYAMCILEEMQWIKTKSIHAAEFFHGTLELVEKDTSMILLYSDDETRPLMDRVFAFASKITSNIAIFDTATIELPVDKDIKKYFAPLVVYCILERLSCHLEHIRQHPLTTRRYYRQMDY